MGKWLMMLCKICVIIYKHNQDSFAQQENDDIEQLLEVARDLSVDDTDDDPDDEPELFTSEIDITLPMGPTLLSDNALNEKIRSLNVQQRQIFDVINKWARDTVKICRQKRQ